MWTLSTMPIENTKNIENRSLINKKDMWLNAELGISLAST
ncbi:hypothetical protein CCAND38_570023 [Capnocytophaga canis]|uniref:Uncharacterized protein n=2 Tax=Capnocytophaga canis TaxID=1848903 RepID=A0A0B7I8I4_9FLAO|nr:hypothetical protein CCAND38_570023 [Capnocytophaga canis]